MYVRVLLDDDSFITKFAKVSPDGGDSLEDCENYRLDWDNLEKENSFQMSSINVPLG